MILSERIRPHVEAAPWVIEEVRRLERELSAAYLELRKIRPAIRAVFDRDVWDRSENWKGGNMLASMTLDKAQFALDNGYASEEDALAYAEAWNREKVSTRCRVEMQMRRPHPTCPVLLCPTLIVEDME